MMLDQEMLLRAYPQMPPSVNARIDATLSVLQQKAAQPMRYVPRLRFAMILAVLLILLAAIGVATGIRFGVFDFMAQFFGQDDVLPVAHKLVQTELISKETDHALITLSQAVYDGGNLRLVYSVQQKDALAPITEDELADEGSSFRQALALDGISPWGCDWFYIDGVEYTMTSGSSNMTIPGGENGEALCYMDICLASAGIVPTQDFMVSLPIIHDAAEKHDTLDFTVRIGDQVNTTAPTLTAKGATVTLLSASLSPVRTYANLLIVADEGTSAQDFALLLEDWRDAKLVDGQGSEPVVMTDIQMAKQSNDTAILSYTFMPTDAAEAYIAPTVITADDEWLVDIHQAIKLK